MENVDDEIIKKIVEMRKKQGITQAKVAKAMNVTAASYSRLESGEVALTYRHLTVYASLFGMSIPELLVYPNRCVIKESSDTDTEEPTEVLFQVKLRKDKKDQAMKLIFGDNYLEIFNK